MVNFFSDTEGEIDKERKRKSTLVKTLIISQADTYTASLAKFIPFLIRKIRRQPAKRFSLKGKRKGIRQEEEGGGKGETERKTETDKMGK